ncbi:ABC transporter substrate-binding protein [Virgisporangium aliadipatigenens]|uniref:ABC transporter substrate-binding protein n=1 Tax=Virgisporangium aliadipatigenens TaxID=741659 RepID=A0A8J3YR37_9ACTN|nr:ABC transporter substrate-binding protein [Virgisporangium aliadipatigenens]GIJ49067.1 ABC transporter substrate-binding protein [Virgisporangium aliadipatigenens]
MLALSGCAGSSLGDDEGGAAEGPVNVGLMIPLSGPYKAIGEDLAKGWELYLSTHDGKFGGRKVNTIQIDEVDGRAAALNGAKKLVEKDNVVAIVGGVTADTTESVKQYVTEKKVPFVGTGGRPSTLTDLSYLWHASWLSVEPGRSVADYIRTTVNGPVYAIGPDYQGGYDNVNGFVEAFKAGGGQLANKDGKPKWTPWPATNNYLPFLNEIQATGAKAVFTFYAGTPAIEFVKQYKEAGLQGKIPLYASGFLTEGPVLQAQGPAADGVRSALNYASNLDNPANREFAMAYQKQHNNAPDVYNVTAWDSALILDRAIGAAGKNATAEKVNAEIGKLGAISSPRGDWRFGQNHSPIQPWYLREVQFDGRARANVLVQNLATLGS